MRIMACPVPPKKEELQILLNLFPKTTNVTVIGPMLVIVVQELPKKPWPLTVAGLPLYITSVQRTGIALSTV